MCGRHPVYHGHPTISQTFILFLFRLDFCQDNEAGVHANPDNCQGFIICDMAGNAHEMDCPAGLKFNPTNLVCDWPHNVECEDGSGENAELDWF